MSKTGEQVASAVLEIPEFGGNSEARYADAVLDGKEFCSEDLTVVATSASAVVDGKRVDLIKTKTLRARNFKPFKLRVGK